ncbi:HPSE [Symbiodinium natans]|uniref:HPSE protein n=1 Tax=Symbiodinium natans TaxID=878477 RepID=A0A812KR09_9DINO|nr:HPSE [Symbiodinium natans]
MTRLHQQLVEQRHASRLRAAAAAAEVRLEDLVEIIRSAIEDGFAPRSEFEAVERKLTDLIGSLTREANADELAEDRAEGYVRALGPLPEAQPAAFW